MARLFTTGHELGHVQCAGFTTFVTTLVAATDQKRTGAYSMKVPSGVSNAYGSLTIAGVAGRSYYARVYERVGAMPAVEQMAISFNAGTGRYAFVTILQNGALRLTRSNAANVESAAGVITAATWYRIEYRVKVNTGTGATDEFEVKVNGTTVIDSTIRWTDSGGVDADAISSVVFGHDLAASLSTTDGWYEDMAVNDDQGTDQNSWPGEGAIRNLQPVADSAIGANWLRPGGGTPLFGSVDNVPPQGVTQSSSATQVDKQIYNIVAAVSDYAATLQSYDVAGVPAGEDVAVAQPVAIVGANNGTSPAGALTVTSNPAVAEAGFAAYRGFTYGTAVAANAAAFPIGWKRVSGGIAYNPTVTRGTGPVVAVGRRGAAANAAQVCQLCMLVESKPAVVAPPSGAAKMAMVL